MRSLVMFSVASVLIVSGATAAGQEPTTIKSRLDLRLQDCVWEVTPDVETLVTCVDQDIVFTVTVTCPEGQERKDPLTWSAPDGSPDNGEGSPFTTRFSGAGANQITAECGECGSRVWNVNVVALDITEPDGDPVTDNNFAFSAASPGVCQVAGNGTSGVAGEDPNVEWAITGITGSTLTSNPDPPKGSTITFTYTTLPAANTDLGSKTLTLKHPAAVQTCEVTQAVQIFFSRDATNHTGGGAGTTRNWYHYWKDGAVVSDLADFEYENDDDFGRYDPDLNKLYVQNKAPTSESYTRTLKNRYYKTQITSGVNGKAFTTAAAGDVQVIPVGQGKPNTIAIRPGDDGDLDTTEEMLVPDDEIVGNNVQTGGNGILNTTPHPDDEQLFSVGYGEPNSVIITAGEDEFLHTDAHDWDALDLSGAMEVTLTINFSGIDCCAMTCTHEKKHQANHQLGGNDTDEDGVPDAAETASQYKLDPNREDTYNVAYAFGAGYASYGDDEFLCRVAEQTPGDRDATKDWSDTNGKQWASGGKYMEYVSGPSGVEEIDSRVSPEIALARTVREVEPFLNHRDPTVRKAAVRKLGEIGTPEAVGLLGSRFEREPYKIGIDYTPHVKMEIVRALRDIGGDEARAVLVDLGRSYWKRGPRCECVGCKDKGLYPWHDGDYHNVLPAVLGALRLWEGDAGVHDLASGLIVDQSVRSAPVRQRAWELYLRGTMVRQGIVGSESEVRYLVGFLGETGLDGDRFVMKDGVGMRTERSIRIDAAGVLLGKYDGLAVKYLKRQLEKALIEEDHDLIRLLYFAIGRIDDARSD